MAELYEYAMLPDHMWSPDDSVGPNSITETGALCISSGSKTGRVPKQKRIVEDDITRDVSNLLITDQISHNLTQAVLMLLTIKLMSLDFQTWHHISI